MAPELLIGVLLSCLAVQSAHYRPSYQRLPPYPFPQSQSPFSYLLQHKPLGSFSPSGDNCCPCSACCACSPKKVLTEQGKIPSFTDEITIDPFTPLRPSSSNFDTLISSHPPPSLIRKGSPVDSFIARPFGSPSPFQVLPPLRNKIRQPFHILNPLRGERMTMDSSGNIVSLPSSGSEYDSGRNSFDHTSVERTSDADKKEALPPSHPLQSIDNPAPSIISVSPSSLLYPNVSLTPS